MKPRIRRQNILSRLRALQQEVKVDELAQELGVSGLTIRRDFDILADSGVVVRTHGGAMAVTPLQNSGYVKQVAANFDAKQAIGRAAAREVKAGDVLLLNDGSTTFHLASCLGQVGPITVYTNSIAMIGEFSRFSNIRLYALGGEYHADIFCLGGTMMAKALDGVSADVVFLGTDAIDSNGRCLVRDRDTAFTAELMMKSARRRVLLADASKIDASASIVYGNLSDFDLWITSLSLDVAAARRFRRFTKVRIAKAGDIS